MIPPSRDKAVIEGQQVMVGPGAGTGALAQLWQRLGGLIPRGAFVGGASQLVLGTVVGQMVVILSAPVLSRMYGPAEFGVLAVYAAMLAVSASMATLRYEVAIPLPKSEGSAAVMLVIATTVVIAATLLASLLVFLFGEALVNWTNTPGLASYLWTVPLGVLLMGMHGILTYWALRNRAFGLVAQTRIQQGIGMATTQLMLGYLRFGPLGLIVGHIVGFAAGFVSLARFWYRTGAQATRAWNPGRMYRRALRYRDYPLYSSWGGVVNTTGLQLPVMLFASYYSPAVAGMYLLSNRVANAPVALVAEAVGKVFYVSAVDARRRDRLPELVLKVFDGLLKASLTPFVLIAITAPGFFSVIFGAAWSEAGPYFQWLVVLMASVFVFSPLAMLYSVLYRHREDLYFQVVLFVARVAAIILGARLGGPLVGIACFALSASAVYIGFGVRLLCIAGVRLTAVMRILLREGAIATAAGAAIYGASRFLGDGLARRIDLAGVCLLLLTVLVAGAALLRVRSTLKSIQQMSSASPGS